MRNMIEVLKPRGNHLHVVQICYRIEDMYETIWFSGEFENIIDANKFADRVREKIRGLKCFQVAHEALNLDHWLWVPSKAIPYGQFHVAPKAKPYVIPTSEEAKRIANTWN
jgi:hypothetical protein